MEVVRGNGIRMWPFNNKVKCAITLLMKEQG